MFLTLTLHSDLIWSDSYFLISVYCLTGDFKCGESVNKCVLLPINSFPLLCHFFNHPVFFSALLYIAGVVDDKENVFLQFTIATAIYFILFLLFFILCPPRPLSCSANFSFSYLPLCRLVARALSSLSRGLFHFHFHSLRPYYPLKSLVSKLRVAWHDHEAVYFKSFILLTRRRLQ